jgi:hypothetical protein
MNDRPRKRPLRRALPIIFQAVPNRIFYLKGVIRVYHGDASMPTTSPSGRVVLYLKVRFDPCAERLKTKRCVRQAGGWVCRGSRHAAHDTSSEWFGGGCTSSAHLSTCCSVKLTLFGELNMYGVIDHRRWKDVAIARLRYAEKSIAYNRRCGCGVTGLGRKTAVLEEADFG